MKKSLILSLVLLSTIISCKKESSDTSTEIQFGQFRIGLESPLNDACLNFLNEMANGTYSVGVSDNPNFGNFASSHPESDIFINGKAKPHLKIEVDNMTYQTDDNGQILTQDINLKRLYGKEVNIKISDENTSQTYKIYVPKPALVTKLGQSQSIDINRKGNTLKWTPDPSSPFKKICLYYVPYDNPEFGGTNSTPVTAKRVFIDDDGEFSLDEILSNTNIKRINFMLISGNAVAFTSQGVKTVFDIRTSDSHEYVITD